MYVINSYIPLILLLNLIMNLDNTTSVLTQFIRKLDIAVTRKTIDDELQKHPNYNSLLAISDVLNNWNVPNAAYELTLDELLEAEISDPFIAFFAGKEFVVVSHLDSNSAIVSNQKWNNHKLSIDEFKKMYSGSILAAEKEKESGEADYSVKYRKEVIGNLRLPVVVGGGLVILLSLLLLHTTYIATFTWQIAALTVFKTAGLITAVLLLIQSIDTNNPLIQKLCGGDNNKNCNAILSSKAAKITDELSWSEMGLFYFSGTWLVLLFSNGQTPILQMLAIINILSLPYTFYSIYHQWKVAKQWCILCSTVQGLLWLEFCAFLPSLMHGIQTPSSAQLSSLAIGMAAPILGWIFIKPYLLLSKQISPLKNQLRTFKYNTELFQKLLNEGVKYGLPSDEHSLVIGNREAENIITMVSNPFCQPCAKAHKGLEWLNGREDIKLQVVFSTTNNENDPKTKVATHLLSLQQRQDDASLKKALDDWYEQKHKNYDAWAKEHPLAEKISVNEAIHVNQEWCKMTEVTGTPTLFINGRKLPQNYQPEDLKYFI